MISGGVTSIVQAAFSVCTSLRSVVILESVKAIGSSVFQGCTNLESIVIPEGVHTIGDNAFRGCSQLQKIILPDKLVKYKSSYGIANNQTVIPYSKFISHWKRNDALEKNPIQISQFCFYIK